MEKKELKKEGVYLSNFVATAVSFFILVLAFAAGFFAKAYFDKSGPIAVGTTVETQPIKAKPVDMAAFLSGVVDSKKLQSCLDSGKYDGRLTEDTKLGDTLGVQGTPAFFVNNALYAGAYNYTDISPVVNYYLGKAGGTAPTQEQIKGTVDQIKEVFNKSLIKFGTADKKVVFVEFSDPSCPYCQIAAGQNSELNNQVGDRFKLVKDGGNYQAPVLEIRKQIESGVAAYAILYRNGHGNGEKGMKALYCAHEQGKFWQAHDLLMSNAGYTLMNNQ